MDNWDNLEGQINVLGNAVSHHIKRTIWWNESDATISIKLAESDTLVELDVINLDSFVYLALLLILLH